MIVTAQAPTLDNARVAQAYTRWAPVYDLAFAAVMGPGRKAAVRAAERAGSLVLDVGVGTGLELPLFGPRTTVVGVDLTLPMLARAAARVRVQGLGCVAGLLAMDANHLGFADGAFDATLAPYLLPVVPDPARTLDELARVTRRGGEIVLVNHFGAETGPVAHVEAWIGRHSASLGWRPQFSFSIVTDWIAARADVRLIERRVVRPFGLFTLVRIARD